MVDSTFRTIPDREHRAMAGLSMGANQALHLATGHLGHICVHGRIQRYDERLEL